MMFTKKMSTDTMITNAPTVSIMFIVSQPMPSG